ncbi:hypothetical protein GCM10022419_121460 [Nonomuraea rosea]|uniref:Transposase n=1 Tax=Nonomuraea rosea TaxID=638574 RepID=A0ABP6ZRD7_9ACTN
MSLAQSAKCVGDGRRPSSEPAELGVKVLRELQVTTLPQDGYNVHRRLCKMRAGGSKTCACAVGRRPEPSARSQRKPPAAASTSGAPKAASTLFYAEPKAATKRSAGGCTPNATPFWQALTVGHQCREQPLIQPSSRRNSR